MIDLDELPVPDNAPEPGACVRLERPEAGLARIVLVAHSHGATWAHIACAELVHIPIEYVVTLDGICLQWSCAHDATVDSWVRRNSPFSFDISQPCNNWPVVGSGAQFNTKDIAFRNVILPSQT